MTTERQIHANRQNAPHSTGPRTPQGTARSSRDNTRHGLRSSSPVIPRLEDPTAWEQHRQTTIDGLSPGSPLEEALAERIALILWRLGRVARYERHVTTAAQHNAPADLAATLAPTDDADEDDTAVDAYDVVQIRARYAAARRRLRALTSLERLRPDAPIPGQDADAALDAIAEQIPGFDLTTFSAPDLVPDGIPFADLSNWTVQHLANVIRVIAQQASRDPDQLHDAALIAARRWHNQERAAYDRLTRRLRDLRHERILPQPANLEQVVRYEAHLMRQLSQTLGHLRQLQAAHPTTPARPIDPTPSNL